MSDVRTYTDIDFDFDIHPTTKDLITVSDKDAIKQSLKSVLFIEPGEKPFNPHIGSRIRALLFEPFTPIVAILLQKEIENTINNFEPRIDLLQVIVENQEDLNQYNVTIYFAFLNSEQPVRLDVYLKRLR